MPTKKKPEQTPETVTQETTVPTITARIDRMLNGDGATKAFASATIAGSFAIHGIRVIESSKGRFVSMPQESYKKNGETKYSDTFHAITAQARTDLNEAVEAAYEQELTQQMEERQGMTMGM